MGAEAKPDFSGYATKAGLKCSDGRTITPDAFKHQDKEIVPLVWQHGHNEPSNVLGHAVLENRDDGVYAYGFFNGTDQAKNALTLVQHKDIKSLSIYANQLTEKSKQVLHGFIREVSLVLSGANPGALIDNVTLAHSDGELVTLEDEAIIYTGLELHHADGESTEETEEKKETEETEEKKVEHSAEDPTVQEIYDAMTSDQQTVVHYMIDKALQMASAEMKQSSEEDGEKSTTSEEESKSELVHDENKEEGVRMTRNVFEEQNGRKKRPLLSHDAINGIVEEAQKSGSLKHAVEEYALKHGIEDIDILFPDARTIADTPEFDSRRVEWVSGVINGTRHSPFSRIKSIVADITQEEARALGYIKGNLKKEEFFGLVKRVTTPSTIYKKQQLDRDDIVDITDFDVVAWLKAEMRLMLDEEIARAILIGDGRDVASVDKIKDPAGASEGAGVRSIMADDDLYAAKVEVDLSDANSSPGEVVDALITNMGMYKGSGSPTLYTTLPFITSLLLTKDGMGRRMYHSKDELAGEMGVSDIQYVEVMEQEEDLLGIVVNLKDYTVGADKGGEINFFDDFDIDYNQYKYLYETRISGALTKIRSALVLTKKP
jgi:Caudovirus prohead serine protease